MKTRIALALLLMLSAPACAQTGQSEPTPAQHAPTVEELQKQLFMSNDLMAMWRTRAQKAEETLMEIKAQRDAEAASAKEKAVPPH